MTQPTPIAEPTDSQQYATWRFVGCSIRGADHQKSGKTNQDAVRSNASIEVTALPVANGQLQVSHGAQKGPMICAISDGHGSAAYTRSEVGSDRAVGAAISAVESFLACCGGMPVHAIERFAQEQLPHMILDRWQQEIRVHQLSLAEHENNFKPYGCTLVCCAVTTDFTLAIQLGDGGLCLLDKAGQLHLPIPADPRFVGGLTSSLCDTDALNEFQIKLIPMSQVEVNLAIVCSDGLENCFSKGKLEQDFVANFQKFIQNNGIRKFADSLPASLDGLSQQYSGDDISIGVMARSSPGDADYASEKSRLEWSENRSALLTIGIQSAEQHIEVRNALKAVEDRIQSLNSEDQPSKGGWISDQLAEISCKLDRQLTPQSPNPTPTPEPNKSGISASIVLIIAAACLVVGGAMGYLLKPAPSIQGNTNSKVQVKGTPKRVAPNVATETDEPTARKVNIKDYEGRWLSNSSNGERASLRIGPSDDKSKSLPVVLVSSAGSWPASAAPTVMKGELRLDQDLVKFYVENSGTVYTLTEDKPKHEISLQSPDSKHKIGPFKRTQSDSGENVETKA